MTNPQPPVEPNATPGSAGRNRRSNLLALLLGVLCCLAALELGARLYYARDREHLAALKNYRRGDGRFPPSVPKNRKLTFIDFIYPVPDSDMIYDLLPGQAGEYRGAAVEINADGLRDLRYAKKPPPGVFRLAGLGDSIAFGQGVALEQTYLKILERVLNAFAGAPRYEVLNFGVPGYNTAMELAQLKEKVLEFEPHAVLLEFCGNDLYLPNFIRVKPNVLALNRSFGLTWLRERLALLGGGGGLDGLRALYLSAPPLVQNAEGFYNFTYVAGQVPPEYEHLSGRAAFEKSMEEMSKLLGEKNIPVLYLPYCSWYEDMHVTGTLIDEQTIFVWLIPFARRLNFIVADSAPDALAFMGRRNESSRIFWVAENDTHPNYLHNILLAKTLFRQLVEHRIIPDAEAWSTRLDELLNRFEQLADQLWREQTATNAE